MNATETCCSKMFIKNAQKLVIKMFIGFIKNTQKHVVIKMFYYVCIRKHREPYLEEVFY